MTTVVMMGFLSGLCALLAVAAYGLLIFGGPLPLRDALFIGCAGFALSIYAWIAASHGIAVRDRIAAADEDPCA